MNGWPTFDQMQVNIAKSQPSSMPAKFSLVVIEMTCKNNDKLLYYLTCQSLALALVSFQLHQCKRSSCDQHHSQLGQCGSQKSKGWTHLFLQLLPWYYLAYYVYISMNLQPKCIEIFGFKIMLNNKYVSCSSSSLS